MSYLWRFYEPLDGFAEYEEGDEQKEESVNKTRQDFCAHISITVFVVSAPLGYHLKDSNIF